MAEVIRKTTRKISEKQLTGPRRVKVGFPQGQASQFVINKAVWNEFGTRGGASGGGWGGPIPERPFMRDVFRDQRGSYVADMIKLARGILAGEGSLGAALQRLGEKGKTDIQGSITGFFQPVNSPTTVALKGFNKPLVETGEMRADVSFKVTYE